MGTASMKVLYRIASIYENVYRKVYENVLVGFLLCNFNSGCFFNFRKSIQFSGSINSVHRWWESNRCQTERLVTNRFCPGLNIFSQSPNGWCVYNGVWVSIEYGNCINESFVPHCFYIRKRVPQGLRKQARRLFVVQFQQWLLLQLSEVHSILGFD